ncbi:hypothetical protein [Streptomyces sp. NPDC054849]
MELHNETWAYRMVRADTVRQVWWAAKQPAYLTLTLTLQGGQEARQDDVSAGSVLRRSKAHAARAQPELDHP